MKIELEVEVPDGYELFGSKKGAAQYEPDGLVRIQAEIILRKKKDTAIVFVLDAKGEYCSEDGLKFDLCTGKDPRLGFRYHCSKPRYRRVERAKS